MLDCGHLLTCSPARIKETMNRVNRRTAAPVQRSHFIISSPPGTWRSGKRTSL